MVSFRDASSTDSPKIKGIEGKQSFGWGKLAEIRYRSHWPKCYSFVIAGSIGFQRVVVLVVGLVQEDINFF